MSAEPGAAVAAAVTDATSGAVAPSARSVAPAKSEVAQTKTQSGTVVKSPPTLGTSNISSTASATPTLAPAVPKAPSPPNYAPGTLPASDTASSASASLAVKKGPRPPNFPPPVGTVVTTIASASTVTTATTSPPSTKPSTPSSSSTSSNSTGKTNTKTKSNAKSSSKSTAKTKESAKSTSKSATKTTNKSTKASTKSLKNNNNMNSNSSSGGNSSRGGSSRGGGGGGGGGGSSIAGTKNGNARKRNSSNSNSRSNISPRESVSNKTGGNGGNTAPNRGLRDIHMQPNPLTAIKLVRTREGNKASFATKITLTNASNDMYIFRVFKLRPDYAVSQMSGLLAPQKPLALKLKVTGRLFAKTDATLSSEAKKAGSGGGASLTSKMDTFVLRITRLTLKQTKKLRGENPGVHPDPEFSQRLVTSFMGDNDPKRTSELRLPIIFFSSKQAKQVAEMNASAVDKAKNAEKNKAIERAKAADNAKVAGAAAKSAATAFAVADSVLGDSSSLEVVMRHPLTKEAHNKVYTNRIDGRPIREAAKIMNKVDGGIQQKFNGGHLQALRALAGNSGATVDLNRKTFMLEIRGPVKEVGKISEAFMRTKLGKSKFLPAECEIMKTPKTEPTKKMSAQEKAAEALREAAAAAGRTRVTTAKGDVGISSASAAKPMATTCIAFATGGEDTSRLQKCYAKLYGRNRVTLIKMQRKSGASISILKPRAQLVITGTAGEVNKARDMVLKHINSSRVTYSIDPKQPHEGAPVPSKTAAKDTQAKVDEVANKRNRDSTRNCDRNNTPEELAAMRLEDDRVFSEMHVRTQLERARKNGFISDKQHKRWLQDLRTRRKDQQVRNALAKTMTSKQKRALVREQREHQAEEQIRTQQLQKKNEGVALLQYNLQQLQQQLEEQRAEAAALAAAAVSAAAAAAGAAVDGSAKHDPSYPLAMAVKIFQHAPSAERRKIFSKVPFKELMIYAQRHQTRLSFDSSECMMFFKSKNAKHLSSALSNTADRIATLLRSDPRSTGMMTANKVRSMDLKHPDKIVRATLCVRMDGAMRHLLKGNHGGFSLVLQAGYSAHVSVSVSTACVQVQGSTKRVADVCRLLKTVLGDNTLWSIDNGGNFTSSGAAKGDCVVLVERECRADAMRVLIGGKNRRMLLEIEQKTRAKIKFVSNKQLKLYIQGGRSQVKAARLEIEQRLIKLGLGIVANQDDVVSPPIPPLTKAQLRAERRNAKKMERLDLEKQANAAKAAGKAAKARSQSGEGVVTVNGLKIGTNGTRTGSNGGMSRPMQGNVGYMSSASAETGSPGLSFMQPASPMGVPLSQRLYAAGMGKMAQNMQFRQQQQMRMMMGAGPVKSLFPPSSGHAKSGLHPLGRGMQNGALMLQGPTGTGNAASYMMGLTATAGATRMSSDEFLSECGASLCGACHSDGASGDKFLCASILMYAVKGNSGSLWNIEDGDTPWTCAVVMNKGATARWRLFVQWYTKVSEKAAARCIARFLSKSGADRMAKQKAQVLIASRYRGWTAENKYRMTKRRTAAALHLQKTWRMWNQRLCMSKKWKRCSSCCYRLRDDFYSSSQIKKGAKRVCLLLRCKDAPRADDPDEVKLIKNMFRIKARRRTLGDMERLFRRKDGGNGGAGGEGPLRLSGRHPRGTFNETRAEQGQVSQPLAQTYNGQRMMMPGFGGQQQQQQQQHRSLPSAYGQEMSGSQFQQMQHQQQNYRQQGRPPFHATPQYAQQPLFQQSPGYSQQPQQVGGVLAGMGIRQAAGKQDLPNTERSALLSLLDRARETVLSSELHAHFTQLVYHGKDEYVQQQLLNLYQNNSSPKAPPSPPRVQTAAPPGHMHATNWAGQQGDIVQRPPGIYAPNMPNMPMRAGSAPPGFDSSGTHSSPPLAPQAPPGFSAGGTPAANMMPQRPPPGLAPDNLLPRAAVLPSQSSAVGTAAAETAELPYGGDLMAAQRAQDRQAIKLLMALRNKQTEEKRRQKASGPPNAWGKN